MTPISGIALTETMKPIVFDLFCGLALMQSKYNE